MNTDERRISRLVGEDGQAGGIPLPPVFGKILEHLLDSKTATFDELSKVVSTTLDYKKARVFATWPNWMSVTRDLLAQLEKEGFITEADEGIPAGGNYALTRHAIPGQPLDVIPSAGISVTVYPAAQRLMLDKISEVRSEAVTSGMLSRDMDRYLDEIRNTVDRKRSRRTFHAGSITPLDDEPGTFRMCVSCENDFELTEENFPRYRSRTEHYWNRQCTDCKKAGEEAGREEKARNNHIKREMVKLINDDDKAHEVTDVMALFDLDAATARKFWDDLSTLGKVPARDRPWK
jgi:hypothetical protein